MAVLTCWLVTSPAKGGISVEIPRVDGVRRPQAFFEEGSLAEERLARIEGFVQRTPDEGAPASWATVAHVGYDDRHLYLLFTAHDPVPSRIRASLTPREGFEGDDSVLLLLDTFRDRQRAYAFRVNPLGVQWDAIWSEAGGFDTSFDTVWYSGGRVMRDGYRAWMAIPWKSLRFPPGDEQSWGVILCREVPREQNETSYWPPVRNIAGWLHQSGVFTGLRGFPRSRNVQLIPFSTFRDFEILEPDSAPEDRRLRSDKEAQIGLDAKLVLGDRFVLDTTLNPDFSQIESDEPQITVNRRFEVFFPERRPFFLENADLFATSLDLLFTRRIADPEFGLRFTGKAGRYSLGALLVDDEAPGKVAPAESPLAGEKATIGVLRAVRDLGEQSRLGVLYVGRELSQSHNRVASLDGRWKISRHWVASGQVAASSSRELSADDRDDTAFEILWNREGRRLNYAGGYREIGEEFEARAGFVPRTGIRETRQFVAYWLWPEESSLIFWGPELSVERVWDADGTPLDSIYEGSLEWHFPGRTTVEVNYGTGTERLRPEDFPALSADQVFRRRFWNLEYGTAFSGLFELEGEVEWGRGINLNPPAGAAPAGADILESELEILVRPQRRLRMELTWLFAELGDRASNERILTSHILRAGLNLQFSRELSLRLIAQRDRLSIDRRLSSFEPRNTLNVDLLVTYRINPWTAVFAGYNGNYRETGLGEEGTGSSSSVDGGRFRDSRQLFVKVSYLVRP